MEPLPSSVLPAGVRSRVLPGINGLDIHVLEAGFEQKDRPAVLLLHGFPELAYSWRKQLPALAAAGYHAIAAMIGRNGRIARGRQRRQSGTPTGRWISEPRGCDARLAGAGRRARGAATAPAG